MKKVIMAVFLLAFLSVSSFARDYPGVVKGSWGVDDLASGQFCNIESVGVCVLAQDEEDCKKLDGKKVDSCPIPESE